MRKQPTQYQPRKGISWPDVYFTAETNREPFEDVRIITLKSHFSQKAHDIAVAEIGVEDVGAISLRVREIIDSGCVMVSEHVRVSNEGIRVVLDRTNVNDDDVLWAALDMVAAALEKLDGTFGKIHFSPERTYNTTDINWLSLH